ncbi:integrase, catalytic region, zinc finger, CCHC-type containing protein, partial [Tanacetum coccineum]
YAIDVEPIPPRQRSNRNVHHGYLNSLKDTLDTLCEIVEEARSELPLDMVNKRDKFIATTPVTKKKHVTFADPLETSGNNTPKHVKQQSVQQTNTPNIPSTRVSTTTTARRSQPKSQTTHDKTLPAKSVPKKKVEDHPRNNKSKMRKKNRVDSCTSVRSTIFNTNSNSLCKTCNECINSDSHDKCVDKSLKFSKPTPVRKIWRVKQCPLTRPTALTSDVVLADPQAHHAPVDYNIVCSNQLDPNIDWGSNVSNSPFSKATHKPKMINTIMEVLHTLHMDLCEPLRMQSINGKKYILVIVDNYSRFTWVKFLRSKDETPAFVINLLKQLQVGLNKTVRFVRTDNGTEFLNKALTDYYETVDITHKKTVMRTPQ